MTRAKGVLKQLKDDFWLSVLVASQAFLIAGLLLFAMFNLKGCM